MKIEKIEKNQKKIITQKNRIANKALEMFVKSGYQNTSLNDIIRELGIAKGTFYHYFSSKDEMVNYFIERMNEEILPRVKKVMENEKYNALQKFNKFMWEIKKYKIIHRKTIKKLAILMYKEENILLRYKMINFGLKEYAPMIASILKQGKQEKIFNIKDPNETAEILIHFSTSFGEIISPLLFEQKMTLENLKKVLRKVSSFKEAMNRILGLKKGKIDIFDSISIKKIIGIK